MFAGAGSVWTQKSTLVAADGASNDAFGDGVALQGATALVGASNKSVGTNASQGAAYVFVAGSNGAACALASDCASGYCVDGVCCNTACGACTPHTCASLGATCGPVGDGCGGTLDCGTCVAPQICGGGGTPSVCGGIASPASCFGLECKQVVCGGAATTSVSGKVFDPAGVNPIYDAVVYVPNATVGVMPSGAACTPCIDATGSPLVSTMTGVAGTFSLRNVPVGTNIPIVIQIGKWRRQVSITTTACVDTPLPAALSHLPTQKSEGDIPHIALSTGNADPLECVLRKIGIADAEFTNPTGSGRVNLFDGNGATSSYLSGVPFPTSSSALWSTRAQLAPYDLVALGCEGAENATSKPASATTAMRDYVNTGGRVFASHYGYYWLRYGPAPWPSLASWPTASDDLYSCTSGATACNTVLETIDMTYLKGYAFATWLADVGASTTLGTLPITVGRHSMLTVDTSFTRLEIFAPTAQDANGSTFTTVTNVPQELSFHAPVGAPAGSQCGTFDLSDVHTGSTDLTGKPFPTGCTSTTMNPQEKAIEFRLFDLQSATCLKCTPRTCAEYGYTCGLGWADGCGGAISCGVCPGVKVCGGGGVAGSCGPAPTCVPKSCSAQGIFCGPAGDGCGGVLTCGSCLAPQTCGGGGVPSQCGGSGGSDCQACSVASGAATDGACGVLAAGVSCRAAAGVCDVAERCDGASVACPVDALQPSTFVCRPSAGGCDVAEDCTGTSATCPPDRFKGTGGACGTAACSAGTETQTGACSGITATCAQASNACGVYSCGATACNTTCAADTDCAATDTCVGSTCKPKGPLATVCTASKQCSSGLCVDGVCCDTACTGQCQACDVATHVGTCSPVTGAPHAPRSGCTGVGACAGACDGSSIACVYPSTSTVCAAPTCTGGSAVSAAKCDALGGCAAPVATSCAPFACAASTSACTTTCTIDSDCDASARCIGGTCAGSKVAGDTCARAGECASASCADGVCCATACTGACQACNVAGSVGTCTLKPSGRPCAPATCSGGRLAQATCSGADATCPAPSSTPCPGGFACADGATCKTTCTANADCISGLCDATTNTCTHVAADAGVTDAAHLPDGSPLAPGGGIPTVTGSFAKCSTATDCPSSFCADGVCCDKACSGKCQTCALPSSPGTCVAQPKGLDLRLDCGSAASCTATCDGSGTCTHDVVGALCDTSHCTDDTHGAGASFCIAAGSACPAGSGAVFDCNAYKCAPLFGACFTECATSNACAAGFVCDPTARQCVKSDGGSTGCSVRAVGEGGRCALGGFVAMVVAAAVGRRRGRRRRRRS